MAKWLTGFVVALVAALAALFFFLVRPLETERADLEDQLATCQQDLVACNKMRAQLDSELENSRALLEELSQQASELELQGADLEQERERLRGALEAKEAEMAQLAATREDLESQLEQEIAQGEAKVRRIRDSLRVDLVDRILFGSGEATLKPEGMEVLRRVAPALKNAARHIEVQGHTDNVVIQGQLAETYPTNWELSVARAVNVLRFLQQEAGLEPQRLSAAGFSKFQPRASNVTEEGRAANRRIEILLKPLLPVLEDADASVEAAAVEATTPDPSTSGEAAI